jgi:hypothetical protein
MIGAIMPREVPRAIPSRQIVRFRYTPKRYFNDHWADVHKSGGVLPTIHTMLNHVSTKMTLLALLWLTALAPTVIAQSARAAGEPTAVQLKQFTIRDTEHNLEWLRCSAGQVWNGYTCIGNPRMLSLSEAEQAVALARRELGEGWRLPTVDELRTLVCKKCEPPKIDIRLFPNTAAAPYWTASKNTMSVGRYWSVSFYTGYAFGRNTPEMVRYVRLVKDLPPRTQAVVP